jgi:hypothetical protein
VIVPPPDDKYLVLIATPPSFKTVPPIGPVETRPPDAIDKLDDQFT